MKMKTLLYVTILLAVSHVAGYADTLVPDCSCPWRPNENTGYFNLDTGKCDPAFAFLDIQPMKNLADRTAELWAMTRSSSGKVSFTENEKSAWREVCPQVTNNAYMTALAVWSKGYSEEFQRMTLTKAMAFVRDTQELENLKFLMACLDDVNVQKQTCLNLARGNGLERQLAARRLALMTSNPQLRNN